MINVALSIVRLVHFHLELRKLFATHRFVFYCRDWKKRKHVSGKFWNISRRQNYFCTIWFFLILTFAICKYQKNSLAIFIFSQGNTVHVGFCIIRNGKLEIIVVSRIYPARTCCKRKYTKKVCKKEM